MTTVYYRDVLDSFKEFETHPIIDTINTQITEELDEMSYWHYYAWKMNAIAYHIDSSGSIKNDSIIIKTGFNYPEDPFVRHEDLINDFVQKSNYIAFYQAHIPYYSSLIQTYERLNPINKMNQWLADLFETNYDSYKVVFSPLVYGAHSTTRFEDNGFSQTIMHICPSYVDNSVSITLDEMKNSRVLFTEIDHNYVNPVSDGYIDDISIRFSNMDLWADSSKTFGYSNSYKVFNEYMTWSLFSLYCIDNYEKNEVEKMLLIMEDQMVNDRGFIKFREFNRKLINSYEETKDIYSLYQTALSNE